VGIVDWIKLCILDEGCISEEQLGLFLLVDNSEQAAQVILRHICMGNYDLASVL
jgi:hypothetical protein